MMHRYHYDSNDPLGNMSYINPLPENATKEEIEEYQRIHSRAAVGYVVSLFIILVAVAVISLLMGCTTTKYVQVPQVHTDTVRMVALQRDSIVRHDSVFVNQYVRGDTVYKQVDRWLTMYRDRAVHDTAYISKRDTVGVAYPVEKQVPASLSRWQSFQIWVGRIVIVALVVLAVAWIIRKRNWWIGIIEKLKK